MSDLTDKDILNAIFSPLLPHGELVYDEDLPQSEDTGEETELTKQIKSLELDGVKLAETGNLEGALLIFSKAIELSPETASAYNNRAQTLRLTGKIEEALADLDKAIQLSEGKGRAACQAYCQRGLIHLKNNAKEQARADFEEATKLGSQFAKAQLVQMNPYAALCNSMLKDVFSKLQQGEVRDDCDKDQANKWLIFNFRELNALNLRFILLELIHSKIYMYTYNSFKINNNNFDDIKRL